ncbi:MAG: class I SAM-dependent methyltransferase [Anaerolineales bacterium]|nr:class I SAM-dependent methyltransferase [Anaerolineales bacterium]
MSKFADQLRGSLLALRAELNPSNHAVKYKLYNHINKFTFQGLDFYEQNEMGHGVWDKYPGVLPCIRHAPYIFEVSGVPADGEDILEIGCGLGAVAVYCAKNFPQINSYTAIDLDEGNIRACKENNPLPDKLDFYALDATKLTEAPYPEVCQRVKQGFHRINFLEVTPEITKEQYNEIFRQCIDYLRVGGLLLVTALTLEDKPASKEEETVQYMIRADSPNLHDILETAAKYPCQVEYKDVTDITIKALTYWTMDHLHFIDDTYTWPFSGVSKSYFRGSKSLVDRGALKQFDIFVRKT